MSWTIQQSREMYNIKEWSSGYFDINETGEAIFCPNKCNLKKNVSLVSIIDNIKQKDISLPLLLRFPDILNDRVKTLCDAFDRAINTENYKGNYTCVYPIKVNQQHQVVKTLITSGAGRVGLEAGSKPELMAALGVDMPDNSVLICNGYKDRRFIRAALIGREMGRKTYIVIEKMSEIPIILDEAKQMNIEPYLGVRVRLATVGKGKWQDSGGEMSKFGLSASQVLTLMATLRNEKMLNCLQLLHCHLGSQIANIHEIQTGLREFARYLVQLQELGASINCVDVGGGLAVDYDGTQTRSYSSMNYTVSEYANNIVQTFSDICTENNLPHPDIISESGRALTAHHAVLVLNVADIERVPGIKSPKPANKEDSLIVKNLRQIYEKIPSRSVTESYHDATQSLSEAQSLFVLGLIGLEERAHAEEIYHGICRQILDLLSPASGSHREILEDLNKKIADKYICNFSLFRSLSDSWGIGQLFPIMPLQRLNKKPDTRVVLQDITCDSDGRIDSYIHGTSIESSLFMASYKHGEQCLLGVFMVGAYQEILGNLHNLFGRLDTVCIYADVNQHVRIDDFSKGDDVSDVLRAVHYKIDNLKMVYREQLEKRNLTEKRKKALFSILKTELEAYTYLSEK